MAQAISAPPHRQADAVDSLLFRFQAHGFRLVAVDDGGEQTRLTGSPAERRAQAVDAVLSVDQCLVYVEWQGLPSILAVITGNENSELLADWTTRPGTAIAADIERVAEAHAEAWG